jgi:carbamoyl-phosphate synthase large subunit
VPTPETWLPDDRDVHDVAYPVFVKPRRGSASVQCFKARNAQEQRFFSGYVENPIIQDWCPGPEVTTDVISDASGELLGVVSRQRIEARSGEVAKGVTVSHPEIADACARIARELPAVGPITVQGLWKEGQFAFTEINARFGGGVPLGIAAGVDSPRWLLARAAGIPLTIPPFATYRTKLRLTRFDQSFILPDYEDEPVASRHL